MARCFNNGWLNGDSIIGSIGSNGLIRWANTHTFGSATSKTLKGPWALTSSESHGGGSFQIKCKNWFVSIKKVKVIKKITEMCMCVSVSFLVNQQNWYVFPHENRLNSISHADFKLIYEY